MADLARSPEQLGAIVRRERRRQKLSQAALGERCGLRQATVSAIEAGHPALRFDTLLAVLAALRLDLTVAPRATDDLFGDLLGDPGGLR